MSLQNINQIRSLYSWPQSLQGSHCSSSKTLTLWPVLDEVATTRAGTGDKFIIAPCTTHVHLLDCLFLIM